MSDKILFADYPSKRGSYGLYSPMTDEVIKKINDIYKDAYAVTVFIDAAMMDGVNVMSSEMLYYLAYGKPNGLGKVVGYLSKNLAMPDTELTIDQCKILFQSIKKNAPAEVGLRTKLGLPNGTDEQIARAMVTAIRDKELTINTMSSESSKALSVDIIKGMSDDHNVLYSGTFSNMKNSNNPMYNQLVRTAVHNFTMSNSGDKGLAEQLLMNAMGLAYTNAFVDENLTSFRIDDMKISDDITASIADTVKKQFAKKNNNELLKNNKLYCKLLNSLIEEVSSLHFNNKRVEEMLSDIYNLHIKEQARVAKSTIIDWKGDLTQTDDIMFIGIKVE
jgi:hypothetical protein